MYLQIHYKFVWGFYNSVTCGGDLWKIDKSNNGTLIAHKADPMSDRFYTGSVFYLHELKVRFQVKLTKDQKQANRALHCTPKEVSKQGRLQKRAERPLEGLSQEVKKGTRVPRSADFPWSANFWRVFQCEGQLLELSFRGRAWSFFLSFF